MRRIFLSLLIGPFLLSCGGDCVVPPCPFTIAIEVIVRSGTSSSGVAGAFVRVAGGTDIACSGGQSAPCHVPGGAGTYQLDIGAPGFQTVHRTVQVQGTSAGCNTCGSFDLQHVDVVLVPAA
jgi:hypothetical protein